jgi:hypothetical protein
MTAAREEDDSDSRGEMEMNKAREKCLCAEPRDRAFRAHAFDDFLFDLAFLLHFQPRCQIPDFGYEHAIGCFDCLLHLGIRLCVFVHADRLKQRRELLDGRAQGVPDGRDLLF